MAVVLVPVVLAGLGVLAGQASAAQSPGATGPLTPSLVINRNSVTAPHSFGFSGTRSSGGGATITDYRLDFGDGATQDLGTATTTGHTYGPSGPFTATLTITDSLGRTASTSQVIVSGDVYQVTGPLREMDTRTWPTDPTRGIGPGQVKELPITGGLLVAHTTALVLNVTVTDPSTGGFVTVYPAGSARPGTSSVNFVAGQTVANLVTVPYTGAVDFYNSSGRTDVVVDLVGSYLNGVAGTNDGFYTGITPTRVVDTRAGVGAPKAVLKTGSVTKVSLLGVPGVVAGAMTAVALNVTAVGSSTGGYLTVYPDDQPRQPVSTVNFARGQTAANLTITQIGADGGVSVYNPFGTTNVVIDVEGYYRPLFGSPFVPVPPRRVLDTRSGTGAPMAPVGPGGTIDLAVGGVNGLPAQVSAVLLNLTATQSTTGGYLTAYPDGTTRPTASSVNFGVGQTVANELLAGVGKDGELAITNGFGRTQVVADLAGYFAGAGPELFGG